MNWRRGFPSFQHTVLLVAMTRPKHDSFISYCTERNSFVKFMEYVLALLHCECSHTEVSLTPHCSGNDLPEQCVVFSLVSFTQCEKPGLLLLSQAADPASGKPKHFTAPQRACQVLFCHEEIKANKSVFWMIWELWCCHAVYMCMNGSWASGHSVTLWSDQDMNTPWPTVCKSSLPDNFALLKSPWH